MDYLVRICSLSATENEVLYIFSVFFFKKLRLEKKIFYKWNFLSVEFSADNSVKI